jgi:broad specificity phosphatase PhoE
MRLYFVRHGQSEANVLGVISNRGQIHPLTDLGRQQAAQMAQSLAAVPIVNIYSSPLLRAVQTAAIVSAALGVPFEVADPLREPDCGIMEGRSDDAAWAEHQRVWNAWLEGHNYDERIEGGESFNDMRARFVPFVDRLVAEHGETAHRLLFISHGTLIYAMLSIMLANAEATFAEWRPIPNTGLIVAERRAAGWVCVEWCGVKI